MFVEMITDVICSHFAPVDCEAGRLLYRSPRPRLVVTVPSHL